jgi:hypothetical protein
MTLQISQISVVSLVTPMDSQFGPFSKCNESLKSSLAVSITPASFSN